jgi:hypothetical protein
VKLTIALPGLFWHDAGTVKHLASQIKTPNLDKLIKRSSITQIPYSFSDLIYSSYIECDSGSQSLALQIAKRLKLSNTHPYFLLAEPTFLRADRDRLLICESELLQLDDDEITNIIAIINSHFKDRCKLYKVDTNLWLLGLHQDITDNLFYPILDIIGENIDEYLPKTATSIELAKLLNEIQMLLFNLELNQIRKKEGLQQINSLWLWDKQIKSNHFDNYRDIFTNMQGINNAKIKSLPNSLDEAFIDNSLIIIDSLYYPCCYRDSYSYLHNLFNLDEKIAPALLAKQIEHLEILVPKSNSTLVITVNKNDKYKFWKNISFLQLLKEQNAV